MGPKQGAIFGSIRNVLICYKLDASQVGAVFCPLQSGVWVFAAALFILQLLPFCCGLHGTNACCSHNEAVPISPPLVATRFSMDSVTAGQGLLGYFTCTCNASCSVSWRGHQILSSTRKDSEQLGTNTGAGQ